MTEIEQLAHAKKVLSRGLAVLGLVWILGASAMIFYGESHHGYAVKLPGGIEIVP
jgi:hypothetical protein